MADVQTENGYTRIANEILDQTSRLHLNGTQYSIILTIWRFTYGFHRCEHDLSITFIAKAINSTVRVVKRELKTLIDCNVITVAKESTKSDSRVLKFNKDYDTWKEVSKRSPGVHSAPSQGSIKSPQEGSNQSPKKDIKDNSKETLEIFFETIWKLYPKKEGKGQVKTAKKKELYKIGLDEITKAINGYIKAKKGTDRQYIQNGSTFFNSGYLDYLSNPETEKTARPPLTIVVEERD